jgi:dihydrofolate reductase
MKVLLDMVITLNGFIAREDGSEDFLPDEGWDEFVDEAKRHNNIVMGRETYEQVTARYEDYNFENVDVKHKVIVTKNSDFKAPNNYVVVHGPEEAVDYIKNAGLETLYLIGGGKLNAEFMKRHLVTDVQLTITPYILGNGRPFLAFDDYEAGLEFVGVERLSLGRLKVSYKVLNS